MAEPTRCEWCKRPLERKRGTGAAVVQCEPTYCTQPSSMLCIVAEASRIQGMRDGVAMAKEHLRVGPPDAPPPGGVVGWRADDVKPRWERVDAALEEATR